MHKIPDSFSKKYSYGYSRYLQWAVRLFCILAVVITLASCQPSPEFPPMVNRGQGLSGDFIISPLQEGQIKEIDAPAHITESWVSANGGIQIDIDTDVLVPEVSNTPVIELRQKEFSDQMLHEMIDYFVGDSKLYKIPHMTKSELETELAAVKNQEGNYSSSSPEVYKSRIAELMETAPDEIQKEYIAASFDYPYQTDGYYIFNKDLYMKNEDKMETQNFFSVMAETPDDFDSMITAQIYDSAVGSTSDFDYTRGVVPSISLIKVNRDYYSTMLSWQGTSIEEFTFVSDKWLKETGIWLKKYDEIAQSANEIPMKWAREQADRVLRDLGARDMKLEKTETGIQYLDDRHQQFLLSRLGYDLSRAKGGYFFIYQRANEGLLCTGYGETTTPDAPTFRPEYISVFVTDEGVQQFIWKNMAQPVEVVAQNTKLAPFDAVFQSFKDAVVYSNPHGRGRYELKNVELRATNVIAFNAPDRTWIVPVWVFELDQYWTTDSGGEELKQSGDPRVIINAIDGGFIPVWQDSQYIL